MCDSSRQHGQRRLEIDEVEVGHGPGGGPAREVEKEGHIGDDGLSEDVMAREVQTGDEKQQQGRKLDGPPGIQIINLRRTEGIRRSFSKDNRSGWGGKTV